jgi:predicted RNA-binding protein with RPS1 domain
MQLLALEEGGELLLEIVGDHAVLLPVVSIPRRDLPEEMRKKFESRRGPKPSDIPLNEFLEKIGYEQVSSEDAEAVPEVGKIYLGKVVRIAEFGAFVELWPGTDGLLHISEIAEHRVKEVTDELHEGDQVMVKVLAIDGNRIKLSRKALIAEQKAKLAQCAAAQSEPAEHGAAEAAPWPAVRRNKISR